MSNKPTLTKSDNMNSDSVNRLCHSFSTVHRCLIRPVIEYVQSVGWWKGTIFTQHFLNNVKSIKGCSSVNSSSLSDYFHSLTKRCNAAFPAVAPFTAIFMVTGSPNFSIAITSF